MKVCLCLDWCDVTYSGAAASHIDRGTIGGPDLRQGNNGVGCKTSTVNEELNVFLESECVAQLPKGMVWEVAKLRKSRWVDVYQLLLLYVLLLFLI